MKKVVQSVNAMKHQRHAHKEDVNCIANMDSRLEEMDVKFVLVNEN